MHGIPSVLRRLIRTLGFLLLLSLAACGGSPKSASARGDKAFRSAPPEVKNLWGAVTTAIKSDDYAGALTNILTLANTPGLTADQTRAVQETGTAVNDQMYAAANKGDPKAKQALADLRKLNGR